MAPTVSSVPPRDPATSGGGDPQPYNAGFDDVPQAYDELRAAGHMARRRVDFFSRVVAQTPGPVLELGSGTGTLLRALAARHPDRTFLGVEPLANYVDFATERARATGTTNVRFAVGEGEHLGRVAEPGAAGLVISVDTLHHVRDLDRVVQEVTTATAPRGRWRAMEPNRAHPYVWAYHVLTRGERTFPARDFLRRVRRAGWHLDGRQTLFAYPAAVRSVPPWAAAVEDVLERYRPTAGAIALDLVRR